MNDLSSSFQKKPFEAVSLSMHEDIAQSPLHVIFFLVVIFLIVIFPSIRNKEMVCYLLALIGMMIAFNLILKWQSWVQRFHLSFLVMSAPLIGAAFERMRFRAMVTVVMAGAMACALPYVFYNPLKSFVSLKNVMQRQDRKEEYFDPLILSKYKAVRDKLKNMQCHDVGLLLGEFSKEYPFWTVFNPSGDELMRLEHVDVKNISSRYEYPLGKFNPCAIITFSINFPSQVGMFGQNVYAKEFSHGKGSEETDIFIRVNKSKQSKP